MFRSERLTGALLDRLVFVAAAALVLFALILVGGRALRYRHPWFLTYSWCSIGAMVAGGLLSAIAAAYGFAILGAAERMTQTAYLLWIAVFALLLLGERGRRAH